MTERISHSGEGSCIFGIANAAVEIVCTNPDQAARLRTALDAFFWLHAPRKDAPIRSVRLEGIENADPTSTSEASRVLEISSGEDAFRIQLGSSFLHFDRGSLESTGRLALSLWLCETWQQSDFFLLFLVALLRSVDTFALHGSVLRDEQTGRNVLVVGPSGAGKTTLVISLIQCGFSPVSDDVVLIDPDLVMQGLNRGFSCTRDTIAAFPFLVDAPILHAAGHKRVLDLSGWTRTSPIHVAGPDLIVSPQRTNMDRSKLQSIDPIDGLVVLAKNSSGIQADPSTSQQQLDRLRQIAQRARFYTLRAGRDVLDAPEKVAALLRQV